MASIKRAVSMIEKFNKEIEDCEKYTDSPRSQFCDPDGCGFYNLSSINIIEQDTEHLIVDWDSQKFIIKANDEDEVDNWDYIDYYQELKDTIAYGRKVIKKTIRVFQSENPDAEMENNEDDDEE